ncbi:MAG: DJ-1/PfpI family protein [Ornithinimicrobium sp.]
MRVGLLLFDQVDLLDVGGPYEVFLTANRLAEREGTDAPFDVLTIAPTEAPLQAYGGLVMQASHTLNTAGALDVLIVPGTIDIETAAAGEALTAALQTLARSADLLASVCTGAVLLARAGLLDDAGPATTHHEDVAVLAEILGDRAITARWVDAGPIVTAGGLSSGLAMALHLVDRLVDRNLALATAAQLAYAWDPDEGIVIDASLDG